MTEKPATETELAHYEKVMNMLKSRWAGCTAETKVKMTAVNEDSTLREESMNEFKATWASSADDGKLTRDGFVDFNQKHLRNIQTRLGWAPELTKEDSETIWEAIHTLNPDEGGISMANYGRYHTVMKHYIN